MPAFETDAPLFVSFLKSNKDPVAGVSGGRQNDHFIARNFMLDFLVEERLDPLRCSSYAAHLGRSAPADAKEWGAIHERYLERHVFLTGGMHDGRSVDRNNPKLCPETFRVPKAVITVEGEQLNEFLIRLVPVDYFATSSKQSAADIFSLGKNVLADPHDTAARVALEGVFQDTFSLRDHRPVFAAFRDDLSEELKEGNAGWANQMRNRLGMHYVPQPTLSWPVFLFAYRIKEVPHFGNESSRPLALPLVIDHRLSPAFCPAPREEERSGRIMNLVDGDLLTPVREVLHLSMPLRVKYLIRAGEVTQPVPENLTNARREHLFLLQDLAKRDDYGAETDADLFT